MTSAQATPNAIAPDIKIFIDRLKKGPHRHIVKEAYADGRKVFVGRRYQDAEEPALVGIKLSTSA